MAEGFSLLLLGLIYGTTLCSVTCLPYLGVYLMGTGQGFADGVRSSFVFILGKAGSYALLGAFAGALGKSLDLATEQGKILGIILIISGLLLPFVARKGCLGRCRKTGRKFSLFVLGISTSLLPCPPLAAVFLLAAQEGSWLLGAVYGGLFGLGILFSPLLLAGGGLAHISSKIQSEVKAFTPYLHGVSMVIMVVLGVRVFL